MFVQSKKFKKHSKSYWKKCCSKLLAVLLTISLFTALAPNVNAARSLNGAVSGIVLNNLGKPIKNVRVVVCYADWSKTDGLGDNPEWIEYKYATTSKNGQYKISVPAGTYRIWFEPAESDLSNYARESYPDAPTVNLGDNVVVRAGQTTSRISSVLEQGGVIHGRVYDATTDDAISGILVKCGYQSYSLINTEIAKAYSDENGYYTIYGLKPYPWLLWANPEGDPLYNTDYRELIIYDQYNWPSEQMFDKLTDIDLERVGFINLQGRIIDRDSGLPIEGATVIPYVPDWDQWGGQDWWGDESRSSTTDENGYFSISGLDQGDVLLKVETNGLPYNSEFYDGADNEWNAQPLYITRGHTYYVYDWQLQYMY